MKLRWLALVLAALNLVVAPAFAHDELVDQSPASNEVVAAGVITVSLTFSDDLIALGDGSGSEIIILNAAGEPMNNGCAVVDGNVATAKADLDQPGIYQVGWRAISADGHPISESFRFEVINETGYVADPDFSFVDCANPYDPATSDIELENPEYLYWVLWGSLGLVAVGLVFLLRPKKNIGKGEQG